MHCLHYAVLRCQYWFRCCWTGAATCEQGMQRRVGQVAQIKSFIVRMNCEAGFLGGLRAWRAALSYILHSRTIGHRRWVESTPWVHGANRGRPPGDQGSSLCMTTMLQQQERLALRVHAPPVTHSPDQGTRMSEDKCAQHEQRKGTCGRGESILSYMR